MCAGSDGKDACLGDSGGPLTVLQNGTYVQVGITVFGTINNKNHNQCGSNGNYGVYTDVLQYRSFIESVAGALPTLNSPNIANDGTGNSSSSLFVNFFLFLSILLLFF